MYDMKYQCTSFLLLIQIGPYCLWKRNIYFVGEKNYKQNSTHVTHILNTRIRIARRFSLVFTFEGKQPTLQHTNNQPTILRDITISNNNNKKIPPTFPNYYDRFRYYLSTLPCFFLQSRRQNRRYLLFRAQQSDPICLDGVFQVYTIL